MHRLLAAIVGAAVALTACGDNLDPGPLDPSLLGRLNALPGVAAVQLPTETPGVTYYVLSFTQPVDHENSGAGTFEQRVSLLHRDPAAPMIVLTSGYWDYYRDGTVELTRLLLGNQISIEHRYFAESRPADPDWTKLTIAQMAADQHAIITALKSLYSGAFLTTGGSKGGMTAVYHRRFYPDDVDGTVPYVAPQSFGAPDLRYPPFVDQIGPAGCRQQLRDLAIEMLANRRAAMEAHAMTQATEESLMYTRVALGPAVESAIVSFEWSFWQYAGVSVCDNLPATTDSDDELWAILDDVSPPSDNSDTRVGQFDAYYYQAYAQLGYPDGGATYLDPYLAYADADYAGSLPTTQPAYDRGAAMRDIDTWVQMEGDRLLFIYGQWDPWTAGAFTLGGATDSLLLTQAEGSHGARIQRLSQPDQDAVYAKLEAWTGVRPFVPMARSRDSTVDYELSEPRIPPVLIRALRAR